MARYKPVAFEPSGYKRRRRGLPRWLVLLLTGIALGVAGVLFVQTRYLPPRLSAAESSRLSADLTQAMNDRAALRSELDATTDRLRGAVVAKTALDEELGASRKTIDGLREDIASVLAALPPDPRGGAVEVRAGRFSVDAGQLVYDVTLTRDGRQGKTLSGVMQLVVAGQSGNALSSSINLKPVPISVGQYQSLRGSLPLPADFKPRQATIRLLDRPDGRQLGMRVLLVE